MRATAGIAVTSSVLALLLVPAGAHAGKPQPTPTPTPPYHTMPLDPPAGYRAINSGRLSDNGWVMASVPEDSSCPVGNLRSAAWNGSSAAMLLDGPANRQHEAMGISSLGTYLVALVRPLKDPVTCPGVGVESSVAWRRTGTSFSEEAMANLGGVPLMVKSVNEDGLAVGHTATIPFRPVLWRRSCPGAPCSWVPEPLPLPPEAYDRGEAHGINDLGMVGGQVRDLNGVYHLAVWRCDLSSSCALQPIDSGPPYTRFTDITATGDLLGAIEDGACLSPWQNGTRGAVWEYDPDTDTWDTEPIAIDCWSHAALQRLGALTDVGYKYETQPRDEQFAVRRVYDGVGWTERRLEDLDDSSMHLKQALDLGGDGNVVVWGSCRRCSTSPLLLLTPQ